MDCPSSIGGNLHACKSQHRRRSLRHYTCCHRSTMLLVASAMWCIRLVGHSRRQDTDSRSSRSELVRTGKFLRHRMSRSRCMHSRPSRMCRAASVMSCNPAQDRKSMQGMDSHSNRPTHVPVRTCPHHHMSPRHCRRSHRSTTFPTASVLWCNPPVDRRQLSDTDSRSSM